ncbi:MAG: prolyl oligopeptidase family serine peptidase [Lysobacteraceae bacterium]
MRPIHALTVGLLLSASIAASAKTPVPIEAFARSSKVTMPRLSPDGRHVTLVTDMDGGNYALNVLRVADMQRTAMLRLPRYQLPTQVLWVSDERLVIGKGRKFGSLEQPRAMGEIIATDYDGKNQTYVYGPERGARNAGLVPGYGFIEGVPEPLDGTFYMRTWQPENANRSLLYAMDARKTTQREIASIAANDMSFVLRADGVPMYAYGTDNDDNYLLYRSNDGKEWEEMTTADVGGKFVPVAITPDNTKAYGYFSLQGSPSSLVLADLSGKERTVLSQDAFASAGNLVWHRHPSQPFAVFSGTGIPLIHYFDPADPSSQLHAALSRALAAHDLRITFVDQTRDGKLLMFYGYSDRDPGAWYLLDTGTNKVSKVLVARGDIDPKLMGERRPFRFKASDGLELEGILTIPNGIDEPSKLPMVLLPHGGPHASGDSWSFDTDAQFLASRGYLVLQVNYRGSLGRGRSFEEAGWLKWGTRIQDDLIDGVRWTIAQGYADASRICAYGASFGAYSAMMVSAKAPELFRCAVGYAGLYDLPMMYSKGDIQERRSGRNYLTRVIGRDEAELAANSPTTLAGSIKVPVLLIHGEADERTPFAQAKAMRAALEKTGNAPEWMAVPKEGHGFYNEANNIEMFRKLEAFLGKHLGAAK